MIYKKHLLTILNTLFLILLVKTALCTPWPTLNPLSLNGSYKVKGEGSFERDLNIVSYPKEGLTVRLIESFNINGRGEESISLVNYPLGLSVGYEYKGTSVVASREFVSIYNSSYLTSSTSAYYSGVGELNFVNNWNIPSLPKGNYFEEQSLKGYFTMIHIAHYASLGNLTEIHRPVYISIFP